MLCLFVKHSSFKYVNCSIKSSKKSNWCHNECNGLVSWPNVHWTFYKINIYKNEQLIFVIINMTCSILRALSNFSIVAFNK